MFALLLVACDPCADLPCEPGTCPALADPGGPEGVLTVQLASLRRLADLHHRDTADGTRRVRLVDGETVGLVSVPAPLGMHPVEGHLDRVRFTSTVPMRIFVAPGRPTPEQLQPRGHVVGVWRIEATLAVSRTARGFSLHTELPPDPKPELRIADEQPSLLALPPAQREALLELAQDLLERQALEVAAGARLLDLRPWPAVGEGPQLARVVPELHGGMLRLLLSPQSPAGPALDPDDRALRPGLQQAATLALSPSWVAALANADERPARQVVLAGGQPYRVSARSEGLQARRWSLVAHGRAQATCGWVDVSLPSIYGRAPGGWGLMPQAQPARAGSGGEAPAELDRLVAERVHERVRAVLDHGLLRGPLQEQFATAIARTEAGALLRDLSPVPGSAVESRTPRLPGPVPRPGATAP